MARKRPENRTRKKVLETLQDDDVTYIPGVGEMTLRELSQTLYPEYVGKDEEEEATLKYWETRATENLSSSAD